MVFLELFSARAGKQNLMRFCLGVAPAHDFQPRLSLSVVDFLGAVAFYKIAPPIRSIAYLHQDENRLAKSPAVGQPTDLCVPGVLEVDRRERTGWPRCGLQLNPQLTGFRQVALHIRPASPDCILNAAEAEVLTELKLGFLEPGPEAILSSHGGG